MSLARLSRTYLYVPGNAADKLAKAPDRGADALLIDLEDAVPESGKDAALRHVVGWLREQPAELGTELWVRVNPGARRETDVSALATIPALSGLALAKADTAEDVSAVSELLASLGDTRTRLMPMIESAAAVLAVAEIARGPRISQLQIGEVDLAGDMGLQPGPDEVELLAVRTQVVLASAAAGIGPPLGAVSRITREPEGFRTSTERLRRLGFLGRACIHPAQVPLVHEVFTPSADEVDEARDLVRRMEEAEQGGSGVLLDSGGRMVDAAVLRHARRTLQLAARAEP